jgi:hypothetical protein
VGVGVKVSTLGIGGELALPVTHRSNMRFGFNAFNYNHTFNKDGVTYKGGSRSTKRLRFYWPELPGHQFRSNHPNQHSGRAG